MTALRAITAGCLFSLYAFSQTVLPLMPYPARLGKGRSEMAIDPSFRVAITGYRDPLMERAAVRLLKNLRAKAGLALSTEIAESAAGAKLQIRAKGPAANLEAPDESYTLTVESKRAELRAATSAGVLRGLATFYQLVSVSPAGAVAPAVTIEDHPRFAWRGLMIDVSRHFVPMETLLRQIDAMEVVKLNVLHLHLSDTEGFRVESRVYPRLQGDGSEARFYTQDDIRRLVAYAQDRGVRIVPEFDVPGHTRSWLVGYPELASKPGQYSMGADPAAINATLDPARENVYEFLDRLFGEMAALFPDRYFHTGGDEVTGVDWSGNPDIQAFSRQHGFTGKRELERYFAGRVRELLRKHGKVMLGWDELLGDGLAADIAIETWHSSKLTAQSVRAGHATIVSVGYYLDWLMPARFHYALDPADTAAYGLTPKQREMTKGTPLADFVTDDAVITGPTPATSEQENRILGCETALWTEVVTDEMLDGRIWPRAAAMAERFWSPKTMRDADSMYERLGPVSRDLEFLGLKQRANSNAMLARLSPESSGPLRLFAETVEPVKFYAGLARMMAGGPASPLADAIAPESLPAREFEREVKRLVATRNPPPELRAHVRAKLTVWRDNADNFSAVARGSEQLRPLVPLSEDVRMLAQGGLEALVAMETHQAQTGEWAARQRVVIEKQEKAAAASADVVGSFLNPQPPAGLTIVIAPAIGELVNAAMTAGKRR